MAVCISFVAVCETLSAYATSLSWHGVCTMHCTVLCMSEDATLRAVARYVALVAAVGMDGKSSIVSYRDIWMAS